ncbi:hypothetical protein G9A89_001822 [Geosiphon pyriformis]|nr:hypothetical protein G9A89_001822 [Geosiphon pyriformis]
MARKLIYASLLLSISLLLLFAFLTPPNETSINSKHEIKQQNKDQNELENNRLENYVETENGNSTIVPSSISGISSSLTNDTIDCTMTPPITAQHCHLISGSTSRVENGYQSLESTHFFILLNILLMSKIVFDIY